MNARSTWSNILTRKCAHNSNFICSLPLFRMHKGIRRKKKNISRKLCNYMFLSGRRKSDMKKEYSFRLLWLFLYIYVCTFWINCMPLNTHVRELNNPVTYLISTLFSTLNYSKNIRKFSLLVPQKRKKHKSYFQYFDFLSFFIKNGLKHFHIISCECFIKKFLFLFCFSFPSFPSDW